MVPHRLVDPEAHEPAEQKVILGPLHQLPLRADRVEGLEQHRAGQHPRRDRGPAHAGTQRGELARQRVERLAHDQPDRPQRVVGANPLLQIHVGEQLARPLVPAPHPNPSTINTAE